MSLLRQLRKDEVLSVLTAVTDDRYQRCRELVANDPRDEFTTTEAPAVLLRENLEPKHRIARTRGKILHGDDELLVALADLGAELVTGVFVDSEGQHVALYLRATTLEPVGCVIVEEGPRA
jgi:hypothetical protein